MDLLRLTKYKIWHPGKEASQSSPEYCVTISICIQETLVNETYNQNQYFNPLKEPPKSYRSFHETISS